jgi:hypothetical protein
LAAYDETFAAAHRASRIATKVTGEDDLFSGLGLLPFRQHKVRIQEDIEKIVLGRDRARG